MPTLFRPEIRDGDSWGAVYQSIGDWRPLIRYIFDKEGLECGPIGPCTPGTNAVFQAGNRIIKIFAPGESGMDSASDFQTERFGLRRANGLGIAAPRLYAAGQVDDRYRFRYLIMERVDGKALGSVGHTFSDAQKTRIGRQLRRITEKLNTGCEAFNEVKVVERALGCKRWQDFPDSFTGERLRFLRNYPLNQKDLVYVHGDLNPDNLLVGERLTVIDFADAVLAPACYEEAVVACELFGCEGPYMRGYFGDYDGAALAQRCLEDLLLHNFGANILRDNLGNVSELTGLDVLRERLSGWIQAEKE